MRMRMKLTVLLFAGMCLLPGISSPCEAQIPRETWTELQKTIRERQADEAIRQVESLLASSETSPADRAKLLDLGAQAVLSQRPPRHDLAIKWHERIVADPSLPSTARVDAIQRKADLQILQLGGKDLHEMDLAPAMATLQQPLDWPELSPRDLARALVNIGKLHDRQETYAQAREYFTKALEHAASPREKDDIHKLIAYSWAGEGNLDKAVQIASEHGVDLIDMYRQFKMTNLQHQACIAILEDGSASDAQQWSAFRRLPAWHVYTRDLKMIRQLSEQYLPAFTQADADRPRQVFMPLLRRMNADEDASFILWAAPQVLASPRCSESEFAQLSAMMVDAIALQREDANLLAQATALSEEMRMPEADRLWLSLVVLSLRSDTAAVQAWLDGLAKLSPEQKSQALLKAGRTLLRHGREQAARDMHAIHLGLLKPLETASLSCHFVDSAPADISQWMMRINQKPSLDKAMLDRPYGNNLQFLVETDSASTGRTAAAQTDQTTDDSRTVFHALCDDKGLHLFLLAYDTQVAQVEAGKLRAGGFEMYLAPGEQQAYHTFLADVATGGYDPQKFLTHYPTNYFHPLSKEDRTFESQTRQVEGGYATYLFMSWAAFYDKLPQQSDSWQFESIRWTRQGGFSFAGSRSVHNRSSWGNLVFDNMGDEQRQAIRRRIIPIAAARYLQAKQSTSPAGNWADPDLGDTGFHQQHVAPLFEKLDEAVKQSREPMTDTQVDTLYLQVVPLWMDLEHHIAHLRREYLQQQLTNQ